VGPFGVIVGVDGLEFTSTVKGVEVEEHPDGSV
jgi:hypothetical protein